MEAGAGQGIMPLKDYSAKLIETISEVFALIIHKKWMKDENMLKKKDFDDAAVVAALRRGHRQRLYFEQIYPPLAGGHRQRLYFEQIYPPLAGCSISP